MCYDLQSREVWDRAMKKLLVTFFKFISGLSWPPSISSEFEKSQPSDSLVLCFYIVDDGFTNQVKFYQSSDSLIFVLIWRVVVFSVTRRYRSDVCDSLTNR